MKAVTIEDNVFIEVSKNYLVWVTTVEIWNRMEPFDQQLLLERTLEKIRELGRGPKPPTIH